MSIAMFVHIAATSYFSKTLPVQHILGSKSRTQAMLECSGDLFVDRDPRLCPAAIRPWRVEFPKVIRYPPIRKAAKAMTFSLSPNL